jgi:uncharacterized protein YjiS (DUF1127 family)
MPRRTERHEKARRTPRLAGLPVFGAGKAARRVTTVASISGGGILQQCTQGRISRVSSFWERSMQFENRLPGDRSTRRLINQRDQTAIFLRYSAVEAGTRLGGPSAASAPRVWSYRDIYRPPTQDRLNGDSRALRTSSDDARSRRAISAAASGVMARAVGGLAAWGETAFARLLFAVMSWMMAQALAGRIAYAEAMYSVDLSDPPASRQTPSGAVALEAAYVVPSEMAPRASFGWRASIRSLLAKFRSIIRRERDNGLAIAELRALDNRMLRDLGISRCDIEYFAGRGDVCE